MFAKLVSTVCDANRAATNYYNQAARVVTDTAVAVQDVLSPSEVYFSSAQIAALKEKITDPPANSEIHTIAVLFQRGALSLLDSFHGEGPQDRSVQDPAPSFEIDERSAVLTGAISLCSSKEARPHLSYISTYFLESNNWPKIILYLSESKKHCRVERHFVMFLQYFARCCKAVDSNVIIPPFKVFNNFDLFIDRDIEAPLEPNVPFSDLQPLFKALFNVFIFGEAGGDVLKKMMVLTLALQGRERAARKAHFSKMCELKFHQLQLGDLDKNLPKLEALFKQDKGDDTKLQSLFAQLKRNPFYIDLLSA